MGFDFTSFEFEGQMNAKDVEYHPAPTFAQVFVDLVEKIGTFVKPWEMEHCYPSEVADNFYTRQIEVLSHANLFVKSEKWKYEEEFRIVTTKAGLRTFPSAALKQVVFGGRTSDDDIENVKRVLSAPVWSHVTLMRAHHVPGSFELKIDPL